ncbi:MAG: hypothetical protein WDZ46_04140 [Solirubrobacterales bacterium]
MPGVIPPPVKGVLTDRWVLAAAGVLVVAQLLYAFFADPVFDADGYVEYGKDFANYWQYNHIADTMRTPGYPLFLSAFYETGLEDAGIKVAQTVILTTGLLALIAIAELTAGRRAARICALLIVLYIPLWAFSSIARTEAIAIATIILATLAVVLSELDDRNWKRWVLAAATLCAVGVIVRPNSLPPVAIVLLVLAYLSWRRVGIRGVAITALLSALPFLVLFGPWVIRNVSYGGDPEPLGHNPFPLPLGVHLPYDDDIGKFASFERSYRFFSEQRPDGFTPELAMAGDPWQELRTNVDLQTKEFMRTRGVAIFQLWFWPETPRTGYAEESIVPYPLLMALHLILLFAGLVGLVRLRRTPVGAIGLGIFASLFALHLLYVALPRYALIVLPFLVLGTAVVMAQFWESRNSRRLPV